jgi:site-specific recombinase XerD
VHFVLKAQGIKTAKEGITADNLARTIQLHRLKRKPPRFLPAAEKKRLLKTLKGHTGFTALRDRVMIEVPLGTGTYRPPRSIYPPCGRKT